jgi:hypothetical protein
LPRLLETIRQDILIPEEFAASGVAADALMGTNFSRGNKSPVLQTEKATASSVRVNRRNVRRVDYKEGTLAATNNNSSVPSYDKSAPSERAIPINPPLIDKSDLECHEMYDDSHFGDAALRKRQKV